jgi:hypothetical protein
VVTMVVSSYVGDAALVAVVGSSPACSWVCLGLFVAVKSKLWWRVPVAYDDWQQVVRLVIFYDTSLAWFSFIALCQSRSCVVFQWWLSSGTGFHVAPHSPYSVGWFDDRLGEVGVICSIFLGCRCCLLGEK